MERKVTVGLLLRRSFRAMCQEAIHLHQLEDFTEIKYTLSSVFYLKNPSDALIRHIRSIE